MRNHWNNFRK